MNKACLVCRLMVCVNVMYSMLLTTDNFFITLVTTYIKI